MNHKARRIVETLACERRYKLADEKGSEYSGAGETYKETGADTLKNFKAVGERLGITPEQALLGYLLKHIDSINTMVREASTALPGVVGGSSDARYVYAKGEGIVGRLDDARNYLDLLECLLIDNGHIGCEQKLSLASLDDTMTISRDDMNVPIDDPRWATPSRQDVARAEELIAAYSPTIGVKSEGYNKEHDPNGIDWKEKQDLLNAGLTEGLDGVWRGATTIDASVRNPGERQTPIFAQPAVFEPKTLETGELS